jgi:hypothetical protein
LTGARRRWAYARRPGIIDAGSSAEDDAEEPAGEDEPGRVDPRGGEDRDTRQKQRDRRGVRQRGPRELEVTDPIIAALITPTPGRPTKKEP